jgi:hypothetical protein
MMTCSVQGCVVSCGRLLTFWQHEKVSAAPYTILHHYIAASLASGRRLRRLGVRWISDARVW